MPWPWSEARPLEVPAAEGLDLPGAVAALAALPLPGSGRTGDRFATLAEVAAVDLSLGRLAEGHADAVAILAEAGRESSCKTWGVWAADPKGLRALPDGERWRISGRKPWCSGVGTVSGALLTATAPDGPRLFAVDLSESAVTAVPDTWAAVGMAGSDSFDIEVDVSLPASAAIGPPGWYVERPGFWFGSVGVAACWLGGAIGAVRSLAGFLECRRTDEHQLAHLGGAAARCGAVALAVEGTARRIDDPHIETREARNLALQIRHMVEEACLAVLADVSRGGGAGPLGHDVDQARRIADLPVYLRQHHARADAAAFGRSFLGYDAGNT